MEDTVIKDDPGIFLTEILVNDSGDRFDIIAALTGAEQELIDGDAIKAIETANVSNWADIPESITQMPYLQRDLAPEGGRVWGVPLAMNADSFGYSARFLLRLALPAPGLATRTAWRMFARRRKRSGRCCVVHDTGEGILQLEFGAAHNENSHLSSASCNCRIEHVRGCTKRVPRAARTRAIEQRGGALRCGLDRD